MIDLSRKVGSLLKILFCGSSKPINISKFREILLQAQEQVDQLSVTQIGRCSSIDDYDIGYYLTRIGLGTYWEEEWEEEEDTIIFALKYLRLIDDDMSNYILTDKGNALLIYIYEKKPWSTFKLILEYLSQFGPVATFSTPPFFDMDDPEIEFEMYSNEFIHCLVANISKLQIPLICSDYSLYTQDTPNDLVFAPNNFKTFDDLFKIFLSKYS